MKFFQATIDTRKFSFEAYGLRKSDALMALDDLLRKHGEQYDLEPEWAAEYMEDILWREIEMGSAYRDRELIR